MCFFSDQELFVNGRDWVVRVDNAAFCCSFIRLLRAMTNEAKRGDFRFYVGL